MSDDYDTLIAAYEDGLRAIDETIADLQRQRTAIATRLTLLRARADTSLSDDEIPFEREEQVILALDIFLNATGDEDATIPLEDLLDHAEDEFGIGERFARELLESAYDYGSLREQDSEDGPTVTGYRFTPTLERFREPETTERSTSKEHGYLHGDGY